MRDLDFKADLHRSLQEAREAVLWKLEGLSEYDVRRPLLPTGTNLLGLVKHLTMVELTYFGETFARPSPDAVAYDFDADPNADWVAEPGESRADVIRLYRKAWVHADATIEALPLDAPGRVRHWQEDRSEVTLHQILVHMLEETAHHRGHADVVRELIDGAAGHRAGNSNLANEGAAQQAFYDRAERAARQAGDRAG